jgi:hypothetical protein
MKLDKTTMAALMLPPGKSELFAWDDDLPGFGVRLRGNGARWVVQYRIGAQQRRESLGDVRKVTIEAARKIARNRFAQAELGTDPAAEKAKARAEAKAQKLTFEIVAKQYLGAKKGVVRDATYAQAEHHLHTLWKPSRNGRSIASSVPMSRRAFVRSLRKARQARERCAPKKVFAEKRLRLARAAIYQQCLPGRWPRGCVRAIQRLRPTIPQRALILATAS